MSAFDRKFTRRDLTFYGTMTAAATAASFGTLRTAFAQDEATPAEGEGGPGLPPIPAGATVIAEGLWNPGNLVFGPDGTLYIAETGVAGMPEEEPASPVASPAIDAALRQGPAPLVPPQVSAVAPDGTQSVLTTEAGGVGIAFYDGEVFVATGGTSVSMGLAEYPGENTINAIDVDSGEVREVVALGQAEIDENPDGTDVNPNIYGLDITDDGVMYVADAGGNTIYSVDAETGEYELFAVVPDLTTLTGAEPDPEFGPRQAVPVSVVIDDGGFINVGLLAESWDGPGILAYAPDGEFTEGVSGLSTIVNTALGPDGLMYASQLTADFSGEVPAPGNVFRITAEGELEAVVEGLFFPHGIAFDDEGNLYVTVNSIISGPDAPAGQVLRIDGIATA